VANCPLAGPLIQMDGILWYKFVQHPSLLQQLLDTGDAEIINVHSWHSFYYVSPALTLVVAIQNTGHLLWGIGPKGDGPNELGKALERLRGRFLGLRLQFDHSSPTCAPVHIYPSYERPPPFDMLSPHPVIFDGQRYPTGIHLYHAFKVSSPCSPYWKKSHLGHISSCQTGQR